MESTSLFLRHIFKYLNISVFLFLLLTVLWGVNKGFDITDEGYYVLGYQSNQEIGFAPTGFHVLVRGLFSWMSLDITNVRILRLLFCLLSTFLFSIGIKFYLSNKLSFLQVFSVLGIGALLSYMYGPQSMSYNSLIGSFLIMSFSFVLIGLNNKKIFSSISFVLSGIILAFGLIVKFPPVLVYTIGLFLFFIFYQKWDYKIKFYAVSKILMGFVIGLLFVSSFFVSIFDFYVDFTKGIHFLSSSSSNHNLEALIDKIGEVLVLFLTFLGTFFVLFLSSFLLKKKLRLTYYVDVILSFVFVLITIFFCFQNIVDLKTVNTSFVFYVIVFFIVYFLINNKDEYSTYVLLFMCFLLPFIGSIGTNNSLFFNTGFMLSSWLVIVLYAIDKCSDYNLFISIVYIILIVVSSCVFFNQYAQNPYRNNSLYTQTETVENERIKLDAQSVKFLTKMKSLLTKNNFKIGDPIIGLYKMPGLVYLLGGKSPGGILSLWDQNRTNQFLEELKESRTDYSKSYFLIKNGYSDSLVVGLNRLGLNFPNDYVNVGSVNLPMNFNYGEVCDVYVHNSKVNKSHELIKEQLHNALVYLNSGNFEESIHLYEKVLAEDTSNTTASNNMGIAYMRLKKYEEADSCFQKVVEIDPNLILAKNNLMWALNQLNSN